MKRLMLKKPKYLPGLAEKYRIPRGRKWTQDPQWCAKMSLASENVTGDPGIYRTANTDIRFIA
jgi:hypothetical protein